MPNRPGWGVQVRLKGRKTVETTVRLEPGSYRLVSFQRPCDGNCGYLDPHVRVRALEVERASHPLLPNVELRRIRRARRRLRASASSEHQHREERAERSG